VTPAPGDRVRDRTRPWLGVGVVVRGQDRASDSATPQKNDGAMSISVPSPIDRHVAAAYIRGMEDTMDTTTQTPIDLYRAARREGLGTDQACYRLMRAGLSPEEAADVSWRVETGRPMPRWQYEDGTPTQAALDWERGLERRTEGEG
jgi:hypothetical protein